jgi:hypothetical protein
MTTELLFSLAVVIGSVMLLMVAFFLPEETRRANVCFGMSLLLLGGSSLVPFVISDGPVRAATTAILLGGAVWFLFMDARFLRASRFAHRRTSEVPERRDPYA